MATVRNEGRGFPLQGKDKGDKWRGTVEVPYNSELKHWPYSFRLGWGFRLWPVCETISSTLKAVTFYREFQN